MEVWIATANQGKIREFARLLGSNVIIKTPVDLPAFSAPPENGATFLDNARIKARSLRSIKNSHWVIGDDSGLEAEGLNNLPGVHSARYAGAHAKDMENCLKLLKMLTLKGITNRKARFVTVLVVYSPTGEEYIFEGELDGEIAKSMRGTDGFGYDPLFIPNGETQTLAELGLAAKNKLSHRARAIEKAKSVLFRDVDATS